VDLVKRVKALVICGYGINCERELALACELAGAHAEIVHARQFLTGQAALRNYHLVLFPGGFSFGDDLGAGKAFANRLSHSISNLRHELFSFVNEGNCILGICNGFQLLVKLGLLPGFTSSPLTQKVSLASNDRGRFENRWVNHAIPPSRCVFTRGIETLYLPIRHAEGKFIIQDSHVLQQLEQEQLIALQYATEDGLPASSYPHNPNGSLKAIGGICDPTGRILGMMAHPESAVLFTQHPHWFRRKEHLVREGKPIPADGAGLAIFKNVVQYLEKNR
jgi:phosphoribosylformylglycinamidine synthase subunit PurQ / glutaminase